MSEVAEARKSTSVAFGGAARVIFPVIYGYLFDRVIQLPFLLAAVLVAGTILLGLRMETYAAETA